VGASTGSAGFGGAGGAGTASAGASAFDDATTGGGALGGAALGDAAAWRGGSDRRIAGFASAVLGGTDEAGGTGGVCAGGTTRGASTIVASIASGAVGTEGGSAGRTIQAATAA
jgi:hypothetical protein